ncbi:MAG: chemotaxis response regulator protein-glutamate methylesterase [Spirochaetes bacterium]|nr:chemotaxis response regulator protein-glutamate methylesterase [Spirochaetota bacterium]
MKNNPIRVLIIDDSAFMRNVISKALNNHEKIEVAATALNGKFGLEKLKRLNPDLIILDLEMPDMNGIDFLKEKNKLDNKIPVIILSSHAVKGAKITMEALSLGASDFILKPNIAQSDLNLTLNKLTEMVLALAKPGNYPTDRLKNKISYPDDFNKEIQIAEEFDYKNFLQPVHSIPEINIISIGISTGGPNALRIMLPYFPENFPVPIVIVQHMPPGFTYEFAENLNKICKMHVKEAENNDILSAGRIFIAPGDKHVKFVKKKLANVIELDDSPPINSHKPSVDKLFETTSEIFGKNSIGCIMTGMGKDGADNIGLILSKGGITIAQDEGSSIVFGMPKIAIKNKNINIVKPLDQIAQTIINIVLNKEI